MRGRDWAFYDRLHGFSNGAALSEHLNEAAAEQHGTIGRAFIAILQNDPAALQTAKERQNAFMQTLPELNGQARTAPTFTPDTFGTKIGFVQFHNAVYKVPASRIRQPNAGAISGIGC